MTRAQRLAEYYRRLGTQPPSTTAEDALARLRDTLDEVEDAYSGIPRSDPPPLPGYTDGRMYPPQDDYVKRLPDGSITARTRQHVIQIERGGRITITNLSSGQIEFSSPLRGTDMALAEDVARLADEIRREGEDFKTEIDTFPSGAVSLRVSAGGRIFDMDYLPSCRMFGVGELEEDAAFNSGYAFGFHDFDSSKAKLLDLLRGAFPRSQPVDAENPVVNRVTIPS